MATVTYVERMPQVQIEVLNNTIDLDHPCYQCVESSDGHNYYGTEPRETTGWKKGYENGEHCKMCNNTRFVLTEEGQAIMDLVKRHTP